MIERECEIDLIACLTELTPAQFKPEENESQKSRWHLLSTHFWFVTRWHKIKMRGTLIGMESVCDIFRITIKTIPWFDGTYTCEWTTLEIYSLSQIRFNHLLVFNRVKQSQKRIPRRNFFRRVKNMIQQANCSIVISERFGVHRMCKSCGIRESKQSINKYHSNETKAAMGCCNRNALHVI